MIKSILLNKKLALLLNPLMILAEPGCKRRRPFSNLFAGKWWGRWASAPRNFSPVHWAAGTARNQWSLPVLVPQLGRSLWAGFCLSVLLGGRGWTNSSLLRNKGRTCLVSSPISRFRNLSEKKKNHGAGMENKGISRAEDWPALLGREVVSKPRLCSSLLRLILILEVICRQVPRNKHLEKDCPVKNALALPTRRGN